jgi:arabinofuranosyltransferase
VRPISATVEAEPTPRRAPEPARRSAVVWNLAVSVPVLLGFAALVWHRRWMSDDGLIVLRTVRQLLAGAGPVFNAGERVEANTSTLWTYLLVLPGLVPGVSLNWAAVVLGLLCSVAGVGLALDAARRLFGGHRRMVPFGALVVVALPPFWDFGTSGLETGLIVGWLGLTWWLLVRRLVAHRDGPGDGPAWPAAFVLGLAPLVRPDLALFGLAAAVALVVLERRRGVRGIAALAAVAAAVPLAYEVFRTGYYGLLVPGTAVAKEASNARWEQGLLYLRDLTDTYWLAVPLLLVAATAVLLAWRLRRSCADAAARATTTAHGVVVAVPWVSALGLAAYVTRVGGDFMHGRMLLPALFCLVLPLAAVPLSRWTALPVLGLAAWAAVSVIGLRPAYDTLGPNGIANERLYYVLIVDRPNPVVAEDFVEHPVAPEGVAALAAAPGPSLALPGPGPDGLRWWTFPTPDRPDTITWLNLGVTGELAPLDVRVLDGVGLTNPLAAHATSVPDGRIGHDKDLPPEWFLADSGSAGTGFVDPAGTAAARAALACPGTRELLESYRAPLTAERFWRNLTGAVERTAYRYDRDPRVAQDCRPVE